MRTWNDRLYLGAMPGRFEPLEQWQAGLQRYRIGRIVCLAPGDEIKNKSNHYWLWRHSATSVEVTDVPVPDYRIPEGEAAARFWEEAARVAEEIRNGDRVFIHCGAGVGRTGTFAVAVLLSLGYDLNAAIREIEAVGSRPETPRQRGFLRGGA